MNINRFRRYTSAAAFLLTLGFGVSSCEKILEVEPRAALDLAEGLTTTADIQAGLRGAYDIVQSVNYWGLRYLLFADLQADNARHTGTFPSFQQIAIANILPDNVELSNMWNSIYAGVNRANYVIKEARRNNEADFAPLKPRVIAEARALRAFHYMNLLAYWGGTPEGYGFAGGLGVPLRTEATDDINGENIRPRERASEAVVADTIRQDFDYAISTLPNYSLASGGTGTNQKATIGRLAALALRMRFELRMRDYAAVLRFSDQFNAAAGNSLPLTSPYSAIFTNKFSSEAIWELPFDAVDTNSLAFFWFSAGAGGRNEVDPGATLGPAHGAGDTRLPVNVSGGQTQKYFRIVGDDNVLLVRAGEVILTRAEALARTGRTAEALTELNRIRTRAGVPVRTFTTQDQLILDILAERRLELANEGHRWFDLRRTNTVRVARPDIVEPFRHLWPIPQREQQTTGDVVVQNPGYR